MFQSFYILSLRHWGVLHSQEPRSPKQNAEIMMIFLPLLPDEVENQCDFASEKTQKAFKVVHSCIPYDCGFFFSLLTIIPQLVFVVKASAATFLLTDLPGVMRCAKNSKTYNFLSRSKPLIFKIIIGKDSKMSQDHT